MDKKKVLLAKTLEASQIPIKLSTYADRRVFQHIVYLLQGAGIKLGYKYTWREYGLMSNELLGDLFEIVNDRYHDETYYERWLLDEVSKEKVVALQALLVCVNEEEYQYRSRLEILASVLFLLRTEQASASEPATIAETLNRFDIVCTPVSVEEALQNIKTYAL